MWEKNLFFPLAIKVELIFLLFPFIGITASIFMDVQEPKRVVVATIFDVAKQVNLRYWKH